MVTAIFSWLDGSNTNRAFWRMWLLRGLINEMKVEHGSIQNWKGELVDGMQSKRSCGVRAADVNKMVLFLCELEIN